MKALWLSARALEVAVTEQYAPEMAVPSVGAALTPALHSPEI